MEIVGFGGKPSALDQSEIESIHRIIDLGLAAEPWKYTPVGQRVRVEYGVLAGLEGIFLGAKKNHRLLLSVTLLQRSVAIQIDAACATRVGPFRSTLTQEGVFAPGIASHPHRL